MRRQEATAWISVTAPTLVTLGAIADFVHLPAAQMGARGQTTRIDRLARWLAQHPDRMSHATTPKERHVLSSWRHMTRGEPSLIDGLANAIHDRLMDVAGRDLLRDLSPEDRELPADLVELWSVRHQLMAARPDEQPSENVVRARRAAAVWIETQQDAADNDTLDDIDLLNWPLLKDRDLGAQAVRRASAGPLSVRANRSRSMKLLRRWTGQNSEQTRQLLAERLAANVGGSRYDTANGRSSAASELYLEWLDDRYQGEKPGEMISSVLRDKGIDATLLGADAIARLRRVRMAAVRRCVDAIFIGGIPPEDDATVISTFRRAILNRS
jgi:hypothetical protein